MDFLKFPCRLCQIELFNKFKMECSICEDFYLCLSCYFAKVNIPPHSSEHPCVLSKGCLPTEIARTTPTFSEWSIDEERHLLNAVLKNGFGNWAAISQQLYKKSERMCELYFFAFFFGSIPEKEKYPDWKEINSTFLKWLPPRLLERKHEYGFMPFRLEFSTEADNDAEFLLTELGTSGALKKILFAEELCTEYRMSEEEKAQAKNMDDVLSLYNSVIVERQRKKSFVLNCPSFWQKNKKRSLDPNECEAILKPFSYLLKEETFQQLLEDVKDLQIQKEELVSCATIAIRNVAELPAGEEKNEIETAIKTLLKVGDSEFEELKIKILEEDPTKKNKGKKA